MRVFRAQKSTKKSNKIDKIKKEDVIKKKKKRIEKEASLCGVVREEKRE